MDIDNFFKQIIDEYLFLDLKNMSVVEQAEGEGGGGLGYPMLSVVTSGMELLGGILQPNEYSDAPSNSSTYFEHYWTNYLVVEKTEYGPYREVFWKLIRHGVAHTYIAKAGITVTKGDSSAHLVAYGRELFNIDCLELYKDFLASYENKVKPKLSNDEFRGNVERNIKLLVKGSKEISEQLLSVLQNSSGIKVTSTTTFGAGAVRNTTTALEEPYLRASYSGTPISGALDIKSDQPMHVNPNHHKSRTDNDNA